MLTPKSSWLSGSGLTNGELADAVPSVAAMAVAVAQRRHGADKLRGRWLATGRFSAGRSACSRGAAPRRGRRRLLDLSFASFGCRFVTWCSWFVLMRFVHGFLLWNPRESSVAFKGHRHRRCYRRKVRHRPRKRRPTRSLASV